MGEVKLTEKRRAALVQAASPDGLDWPYGNRSLSATCHWLYKNGLTFFECVNGKDVLVATCPGRAAIASMDTDGQGGERNGEG